MLFSLVVKPLALAALGAVLWLLWRTAGRLAPAEARGARAVLGAGTAAIAGLVLVVPAWAALRERPAEIAAWGLGLAGAALAVLLYARLLRAARRRAGGGAER